MMKKLKLGGVLSLLVIGFLLMSGCTSSKSSEITTPAPIVTTPAPVVNDPIVGIWQNEAVGYTLTFIKNGNYSVSKNDGSFSSLGNWEKIRENEYFVALTNGNTSRFVYNPKTDTISLAEVPGAAFYRPGTEPGQSSSLTPSWTEAPATSITTSPPMSTPSLGFSRTNPAPIGTTITAKGTSPSNGEYTCRIKLVEVIKGDQAWKLIVNENNYNTPPGSGQEYILAKFHFDYLTSTKPDSTYWIWYYDFDAISEQGKEYPSASVIIPGPILNAHLYPGASTEGWASFLVDIDDHPLVAYNRDYAGRGGIWFKLY